MAWVTLKLSHRDVWLLRVCIVKSYPIILRFGLRVARSDQTWASRERRLQRPALAIAVQSLLRRRQAIVCRSKER